MESIRRGDLVIPLNSTEVYRVTDVHIDAGREKLYCRQETGSGRGTESVLNQSEVRLSEEDLPILWTFRSVFSGIGVVAMIFSVSCAIAAPQYMPALFFSSVFWALAPPLFMVFEYAVLVPKWGNPRNSERLKEGQALAQKFWLAIGVLLTFLYSVDEKRKPTISASAPIRIEAQPPAATSVKATYEITPK